MPESVLADLRLTLPLSALQNVATAAHEALVFPAVGIK